MGHFVSLPYSRGRSCGYSNKMHYFFVTTATYCKDVYVHIFFPRKVRLWNSLPAKCIPLTYDINDFDSRVNWHLLSLGPF